MALCHAVAHADGIELDGLATRLENALLDLGGKLPERLMARADLIPAVCDGDQRLIRVLERIDGDTSSGEVRLGDGALNGSSWSILRSM